MANEKMPVAVYQIDLSQFEGTDFGGVVDLIVGKAKSDGSNIDYEPIVEKLDTNFFIRIVSGIRSGPPRWRSYLGPVVEKQSPLHSYINNAYLFIAFIGYGDCLFAIAGGGGSAIIDRFTNQNFGLEILVRLFEKDDQVIKGIQDRGLTGIVLGQTKFYRGDQRFSDENQFGKIFQKVQAELNKKILTSTFGFNEKDLTRKVSGCLAKSSFSIGKSVDFKTTLELIRRFTNILKQKPKFALNKVELLSKRKYASLVNELDDFLQQKIYEDWKISNTSDIDICNKEFEKYLTAARYEITTEENEVMEFDNAPTLDEIVFELNKYSALKGDQLLDFKCSLLWRQIKSFDEEGVLQTEGNVMEHVHGEVEYKGNHYFFLDGEWYKIDSDFVQDLNKECSYILNKVWDDTLITEIFDIKKTEHAFNKKFIGRENWLVFDTITPDNIEPCDLLNYDDSKVIFIHVKKGFDNSVRDLASQILIAAKRIQEDIKTSFAYINKVEKKTLRGKSSKSKRSQNLAKQTFPPGGLKEVFKDKKDHDIVFCLAFVDSSPSRGMLKHNITSFNSNIAKFSLMEVHRGITALGYDFKVIQLSKTG